ncbi:MAG: hypothetical protein M1818_008124 [Claussenomyces sp. TS43310]|nr:MAG: hypothetical protein M1818_008124 [Claussenomyces sp. TS43310]
MWACCDKWQTIAHPRDLYHAERGSIFPITTQELLLSSDTLWHYRALHRAGWVRFEFKTRDRDWGQIRVYILPDDIGRTRVERSDPYLRKSLQGLLLLLETDSAVWNSTWSPKAGKYQKAIGFDDMSDEDQISLFYMFNTLPSPKPDASIVRDINAKTAMVSILDGSIEGMTTKMLPYQRRSAAMMLQREAQPGQIIDPRLRRPIDLTGKPWFCDIATGSVLREPRMYEAARGGICAETMGLGKTLICLALILATREYSSQIPAEYSVGTIPSRKKVGSLLDMCAATVGRTGTPWKRGLGDWEEDGSEYSRCTDAIRREIGHYYIPGPPAKRVIRRPIETPPRKILLSTATLVVVPSNLVRQWEREIEKHTTGLKVLVMKDPKKELPRALELRDYDVILFSRQRFEQESKDGTDSNGNRPYLQDQFSRIYRSPLRDVHFKRLITDEGHIMGNSSNSSKTNAVVVVDFLQLSSRWIVSGTPTGGLYGADTSLSRHDFNIFEPLNWSNSPSSPSSGDSPDTTMDPTAALKQTRGDLGNVVNVQQERKDLEKLGNIAKMYLKSRPWSKSSDDQDNASWSSYVMQPRHGPTSHGNMTCLRNTLQGMIIRHRSEDVERDLALPPLYQKTIFLEGSLQDKLSINIFSLMITSNAVTSERKDADYLFHPSQRRALATLVANLRQASFFWSGFTKDDVQSTIKIADAFLEKGTVYTTEEDKSLLRQVVKMGTIALSNPIWLAACEMHEMPIMLKNDAPPEARKAWALDGQDQGPTLLGATQLHALQKLVVTYQSDANQESSPPKTWPLSIEDFARAGRETMEAAKASVVPAPRRSHSKVTKIQRRLEDAAPILAGGLKVGGEPSPKKKQSPVIANPVMDGSTNRSNKQSPLRPGRQSDLNKARSPFLRATKDQQQSFSVQIPNSSSITKVLESATIISTASSKLSYLVSQVLAYQAEEKIIIFYEADNVAFYIAQALEAVSVEHLIYAKSLSSDRRSRYLETFNNSPKFRVLLMDIAQAAFGLDISSASRVYFVNPLLSKQVEAQAVKRAHRMGQTRPVYVETLVLKETIEEMIVQRRKEMTSDEQKKCKTVLDDQTMYDWVQNVKFVPIPETVVPSIVQMAMLETPQLAFGRKAGRAEDPDDGLLEQRTTPTSSNRGRGTGKQKMVESTFHQSIDRGVQDSINEDSPPRGHSSSRSGGERRKVAFLINSDNDSENTSPGTSYPGSSSQEIDSDPSHLVPQRPRSVATAPPSLLVTLKYAPRGPESS